MRQLQFGASVALSGTRAVIGAPWDETDDTHSGAVYVFDQANDGLWDQAGRIAPPTQTAQLFGTSVAIAGERAVVGAPWYQFNQQTTGALYLLRLQTGGVWQVTDRMLPEGMSDGGRFGAAAALSGTQAVVGAPQASTTVNQSGEVYFYGIGITGGHTDDLPVGVPSAVDRRRYVRRL